MTNTTKTELWDEGPMEAGTNEAGLQMAQQADRAEMTEAQKAHAVAWSLHLLGDDTLLNAQAAAKINGQTVAWNLLVTGKDWTAEMATDRAEHENWFEMN